MGSSVRSNDEVMADINVTPLVDVVLVLLIVFMVTAQLIASHTLPLDLPKAATGGEQQVVFSVEVGSSGAVVVDGKPVANEDAVEPLAKAAVTAHPDVRAVINADGAVRHATVVKVMDRMKRAGIVRIAFGVSAEE